MMAPSTLPSTPDIREYLAVLRHRKVIILGVTALVVGSALAFSLTRTPVYESEAQVLVRPITLSPVNQVSEELNMETEKELAGSVAVAQVAARELEVRKVDALLENLSVSVSPNTEILSFSYSLPDPAEAQRRAAAFSKAYLENRYEQVVEDLLTMSGPIEDRIQSLRAELAEVNSQLASTTDEVERTQLQTTANSLEGRIVLLEQQINEFVAPDGLRVGSIVKPADRPQAPASPNHKLNVALALMVGLGLGVGLAFLKERVDDAVRGRRDLETHAGVPVLAVVPRFDEQGNVAEGLRYLHSAPGEAYRTLRTGLLFAASQNGIKTVLVTSPEEREGKTTTVAYLGVSLSQSGKKVVLVSGDLRKPRLQQFFGSPNDPGLTSVIGGEESVEKALYRPPGIPNLWVLSSGPIPGNPTELLSSPPMLRLLRELEEKADYVLIDAPPVNVVADSMALAQFSDAVLLVVHAGTSRSAVHAARENLERVNARVFGAVLNNLDPSKARDYGMYQHYGRYGHTG